MVLVPREGKAWRDLDSLRRIHPSTKTQNLVAGESTHTTDASICESGGECVQVLYRFETSWIGSMGCRQRVRVLEYVMHESEFPSSRYLDNRDSMTYKNWSGYQKVNPNALRGTAEDCIPDHHLYLKW